MGIKIFNGRYTADSSESSFVVFIIGMRLNQIYKIWKWIPVFNSMGPMIKYRLIAAKGEKDRLETPPEICTKRHGFTRYVRVALMKSTP